MGKSKMIAKSCPKCDLQVAVASKSCKCGHTFFLSRRSTDAVSPSDELRRRTARVRRGKPQFYDSQDYQKQKRRSPKKRSLSRSWEDQADKAIQGKDKESAAARARRRRALRRAQLETNRNEERGGGSRERTPQLRPAQLATCNIILAEINRKMGSVVWKPTVE